ncbi:MAG: GNAT family N-acetyltransferase [Lachnospiraceae bacterium]|nr:GNAT family N-acetyltransferase [Lachnospiraceae bacterium]
MNIKVREFRNEDIHKAIEIWNQVVEDGVAFPQIDKLTVDTGLEFFQSQSYTGIAYDEETGQIAGLYILHPNNIGRCGHICNASYAVSSNMRGHHIGERLVLDCLKMAKEFKFGIMQFNAVVKSNKAALALYKKLGFVQLGVIPDGFMLKDGSFEDIIPHYHIL